MRVDRVHDEWTAYDLMDEFAGTRVRVVPGRGGMITEWECQKRPLLFMDRETYADESVNVRGGIPVLFPISGRLRDDSYTIGGKAYRMLQHGVARRREWEVIGEAADSREAAIYLRLRSDAGTREQYPFDFELRFEYVLRGRELLIRQFYTNRSEVPMPVYPGLHPYFAAGEKRGLRFKIPANACHSVPQGEAIPVESPLDWDAPEINRIYRGLTSTEAAFVFPDGARITLNYSPEYRTLVFWTLRDRAFVCLEPCVEAGDHLNFGAAPMTVQAGGTVPLVIRLTFTPGEEGDHAGNTN